MNRQSTIIGFSAVSLIAAGIGAQPITQPATRSSSRVVFVCEHGTVKSLVALEYFNRLARARGLRTEASSRGTRPDSLVPSPVRIGLEADGFDVSGFRPERFTRADLGSGVLIVALDADVDDVVDKTVAVSRWDGLPSVIADYPGARNALVTRIQRLVDSLALEQGRAGDRRVAKPRNWPLRVRVRMTPSAQASVLSRTARSVDVFRRNLGRW